MSWNAIDQHKKPTVFPPGHAGIFEPASERQPQSQLNLALWKGRRERKWRARRNRREVRHDAMDMERSAPASTEGRGESEHRAHLVVHTGVVRVVGQVESFRR